jgi:hypothetical protein
MIKMKATRQQHTDLTRRLLRALPSSRFEMATLTRLAGIVTTNEVATASVECKRRPRMRINPEFVAEHCPRDEHLFLLVMHELWHVLLAHTRMYPFSTRAHNIAFDAIINAGLMATFDQPEYQGFFDGVYKADEFPYCLLRPPEGWPYHPVYPEVGPPGTKALVERLYPRFNYRGRFQQQPLYEEVLQLLLDSGMNLNDMPILLLGNHDGPPQMADGTPINDPFMKNALKEAMKKWTSMTIDGRGYGRGMNGWQVAVAPDYSRARRAFSAVLRHVLERDQGFRRRKARVETMASGANGVLMNPHDRLAPARQALGINTLLYAQRTPVKARLPERPTLAHVYLDVSGSMRTMLPHLLSLLIGYAVRGEINIFQFSTSVTELKTADLRDGRLSTTGGTSIDCVLAHMVEHKDRVHKALLVTDGAVGAPSEVLRHLIEQAGTVLHAVLPHGCQMHAISGQMMQSVVELPPPD